MREREAIDEHLEDFFGIVVDAHILETFQNATSGYILSNNLNYVIDPVTYKFSLDPITDCVSKRWYGRLISNYEMEDIIQLNGMVNSRALRDQEELRVFVESVMRYQAERVSYLSAEPAALLRLLERIESPELGMPYCLIPPYFIIDSGTALDINIRLAEGAAEVTDHSVFAFIAIDSDVLYNERSHSRIISSYSELDVEGYFVWVTDFNEVKEKRISLGLFKTFLDSLKSETGDKELINMFGGFFSTCLATQGSLDGLVHGIGMSESRDPYQLGGPAPTRYYVPILHRMLSLENAEDLVENEIFRCNCPVCIGTLPSDMSVAQLIQHVLNAKVWEKNRIRSMSLAEIGRMLDADYRRIVSARTLMPRRQRMGYANHLLEWSNVLRSSA